MTEYRRRPTLTSTALKSPGAPVAAVRSGYAQRHLRLTALGAPPAEGYLVVSALFKPPDGDAFGFISVPIGGVDGYAVSPRVMSHL